MRWACFVALLYGGHFLQAERDRLRSQFERLQQRSMTVAEYRGEFTRLERFAPGICTTEAEQAKRFLNGLDLEILSRVASVTYPMLAVVVSIATLQESILHHLGKHRAESTPDQRSQRRHH